MSGSRASSAMVGSFSLVFEASREEKGPVRTNQIGMPSSIGSG
jgi:hypothetical protein